MNTAVLYKNRIIFIKGVILFFALLFLVRLFFIQVISEGYRFRSEANAVKHVYINPARGLIYDRNGKLLVYNAPLYDIVVIGREVDKQIDTTLLCKLLHINKDFFEKQIQEAKSKKYNYGFSPFLFIRQVSLKDYARFQEYLYLFKGFYGKTSAVRKYTYNHAAHVLGYIGEVNQRDLENAPKTYKIGDYKGKTGIEIAYEAFLKGEKGLQYLFEDALGRSKGKYKNGEKDKKPVAGQVIHTSIDMTLQMYAEKLMQNKKGSIVAIEPRTGEILAMVSSPSYNPNALCGRDRGENYKKLINNKQKPLFNRAIQAQYPPGSTFKPLTALVALEEKAINPHRSFICLGYYDIPGYRLRCSHRHKNPRNMQAAIAQSCNPYFWHIFRQTIDKHPHVSMQDRYTNWVEHIKSFGWGEKLDIDLFGELKGAIPPVEYYNKLYGRNGWKSPTILSLGIGQGEMLVTPIQLANIYAAIANRGFYIRPHLVTQTGKESKKTTLRVETSIQPIHFKPIVEGLYEVVDKGTAQSAAVEGLSICGKTGTAQNPHGEDHSIFAGFAPQNESKIAVSVVVENAGFGSTYAAPIASLVMEKYINDTISAKRRYLEKRMMEAILIDELKQ